MAYIASVLPQVDGGTGGSSITTSGSITTSLAANVFNISGGTATTMNSFSFIDDFLYYSTTNPNWVVNTGSSTAAVNSGTNNASYPGYYRWTLTGTGAANGINGLSVAQTGQYLFGNGILTFTFWFNVEQLSTAGNTFTLTLGLGTLTTMPSTSYGVWLAYTNGTNSGDWTFNTASASSQTNSNSTVPVATGWQVAQIIINAAASSVNFLSGTTYANLTSMGTIATNIPTNGSFPLAPFFNINCSNYTSNFYFDFDLITANCVFTTAR